MLVLLTRPSDEAARSAERLQAMGHAAVLSPVIEIEPIEAAWPQGVIDAVIATSARAFECLDLAPDWPVPEARRLFPLFVVGAKTAAAARARGFDGPQQITLDAKALSRVIIDRFVESIRILYLAGSNRKSDLESACAEAGLVLDVLETYAAHTATKLSDDAVRQVAAGEVGAVLHFSRRSAEIFLRLAAKARLDPARLTHIAISEDVAGVLAALPKVMVAAEPNEDAVLALCQPLPAGRT